MEQKLGIKPGETTPDKEFSFYIVECLASCGTAPVLQVNDDFYENLTFEKVDRILAGMEKSSSQLQEEYDRQGVAVPGKYSVGTPE